MQTITAKADWWFIGLDETQGWRLPAKLAPHVAKIRTVYLFNRQEATHCCELALSHYLIGIDFSVDYVHGFYLQADYATLAEQIDELVRSESPSEQSHYRHVRAVDALLARPPKEVPRYQATNHADAEEKDLWEVWSRSPKF